MLVSGRVPFFVRQLENAGFRDKVHGNYQQRRFSRHLFLEGSNHDS